MQDIAYNQVECFKAATGKQDFSPLGTECTFIQGAQNRAITLSQLREVVAFILSCASGDDSMLPWLDLAPPEYSKTSGQNLHAHVVNLYQVPTAHELSPWHHPSLRSSRLRQVNDWVIKPATDKHRCSLVELMCAPGTEKQTPTWFVSHCWCVFFTLRCNLIYMVRSLLQLIRAPIA